MQVCGVCGLLFAGTDECPSCGSRVLHATEEELDSQDAPVPSGPLPGKSELDEAKDGMTGLDLGLGIELPKPSSASLPFQVGGVGQVTSNLPFGVGAPAGVVADPVDEEKVQSEPSVEFVQPELDAPVSAVEEQVVDDDPWAVSETVSYTHLRAHET